MKITKAYRQTAIGASKLGCIRDYLASVNSASLGHPWDHKIWRYTLHYGAAEEIKCENFDQVQQVVGSRGETTAHVTYFESSTGRCLRIDTTHPTRITVEAENRSLTIEFLRRLQELLEDWERIGDIQDCSWLG